MAVARTVPQDNLLLEPKTPTIPGAPWKAAPDTGIINVALDAICHIVFRLGHNGAEEANYTARLEYNVDGTGWNDVTAASLNIRSAPTTRIVDGTDVPQLLGSGPYLGTNAGFDGADGAAGGANLDWPGDAAITEVNVQFAFVARSADLMGGEVIELRVKDLEAYGHAANLTVAAPAANVTRAPAHANLALTTAAPNAVRGSDRIPPRTDLVLSTAAPDLPGALWKAAPDTGITDVALDSICHIVFRLDHNGAAEPDYTAQLEASVDGGAFFDVTGSSANIRAAISTRIADGTDVPQLLGSGAYLPANAGFDDVDGAAGGAGLDWPSNPATTEVNVQFAFVARSADLTGGEVIELRVKGLDAYDHTANLTIAGLGGNVARAPAQADLAISAAPPSVGEAHAKMVPSAILAIDAKTPATVVGYLRLAPQADLVLDAKTPAPSISWRRAPAPADLAVSSAAPTVDEDHEQTVTQADLVIAAKTPTQGSTVSREPPRVDLVMSGEAPQVEELHVQSPAQADLAISAAVPDLRVEMVRIPPPTNLVLDATSPTIFMALLRIAPPAELAVSGAAPRVDQDHVQTVPKSDLTIEAGTPDAITAFFRSVPQSDLAIDTFRPGVDSGGTTGRHSGLLRNVGKMMR